VTVHQACNECPSLFMRAVLECKQWSIHFFFFEWCNYVKKIQDTDIKDRVCGKYLVQ